MDGGCAEGLLGNTLGIAHAVLSGACQLAFEEEIIAGKPVRRVPSPNAHSPEVIPAEPVIVRHLLETARDEKHPRCASPFPYPHQRVSL